MKKTKVQPQPRPAGFATSTIFVSALLALVTLWAFWPVSHCDFLNYDDDGYVTANSHVRQGLNAGNGIWAFRTFETANWHPLTWLSLMLDAQLFGNNPLAFHLTNLFLAHGQHGFVVSSFGADDKCAMAQRHCRRALRPASFACRIRRVDFRTQRCFKRIIFYADAFSVCAICRNA